MRSEYWEQSVRKSEERIHYFTKVRPNPFLAAIARESNRVAVARLRGDTNARMSRVSELRW
jgi:hypothetical protein